MIQDDSSRIGFIAQEMELIIPEVVDGEDAEYQDVEVKEGVFENQLVGGKGMAYGHLVPVLVNAIKELSAKIEALENA